MIVQHPNGNSYIFVDNRVFVSSYFKDIKSLVTVELDLSLPLNEWEKAQMSLQPKHECNTPNCYSGAVVSFGEVYCFDCNSIFEHTD